MPRRVRSASAANIASSCWSSRVLATRITQADALSSVNWKSSRSGVERRPQVLDELLRALPGREVAAGVVLPPGPYIKPPLGDGPRRRHQLVREPADHRRDVDPLDGRARRVYGPKEEPIVPVTQYAVTQVSRSSRGKTDSMSPPQSLQLRSFSPIQAASPAGESPRATASVCGLVACSRR